MRFAKWKPYIHPDWSELRQSGARHYFKAIDLSEEQRHIRDLEEELEINLPADLLAFYREVGVGFLWSGEPRKKGHYRVFSPGELLELYFEPEEEGAEDLWMTFRQSAWENLENSALLAFCDYGGENSLLYLGLSDGAVYYLSARQKIADTLDEFLDRLDEKVDYFTAR